LIINELILGLPDNHVNYWRGKMPENDHWRFETGFLQGWNDGKLFFTFSGNTSLSEIGYKTEWIKRRVAEHASAKGGGEFLWEFGELFPNQMAPNSNKKTPHRAWLSARILGDP
jgi:hypothetical protein